MQSLKDLSMAKFLPEYRRHPDRYNLSEYTTLGDEIRDRYYDPSDADTMDEITDEYRRGEIPLNEFIIGGLNYFGRMHPDRIKMVIKRLIPYRARTWGLPYFKKFLNLTGLQTSVKFTDWGDVYVYFDYDRSMID